MPGTVGRGPVPVIRRIAVEAFRVPLERPLPASFGVMTSRPAVFLRIEDGEGGFGLGEIFANWPAAGAEHRARLLLEDIAPLVIGRGFASPDAMQQELTRLTRIRALQCGEPGPFRQCIAGLDQAAWDLCARRAGRAVARFIRAEAPARVPIYASGVHYDDIEAFAPDIERGGVRFVKFKVGFGRARDLAGIAAARARLRSGETLMLDANQAWTLAEASAIAADLAAFSPLWLEEPLAADQPAEEWRALAGSTAIPLAGGENIAGDAAFVEAVTEGALAVIQPDIAKWGGMSGGLRVARHALAAGRRLCPHFLGGGLGLIASAHFLAGAGGDGLLEVDVNPNPLRDFFLAQGTIAEGHFHLPAGPGFGVIALPPEIARYRSYSGERF